MVRKLNNFIDGFMKYTDGRGSPTLYRKWAAIFTVAAACERKVWLTTAKGQLFPNQYIVLVGPAGVGKSLCTSLVNNLFTELSSAETPFHLSPTSVTKASLVDALGDAERRIIRPMEIPSINSFNSLTAVINELGVFLPAWESTFMSALTDLWDNGKYHETRRTSKTNISIPKAQVNLFSATTPAYLNNLLPEGAWEEGFMSRILLVYSGENIFTDLFCEFDMDEALYKNLLSDLKSIYSLWGGIKVDDEAKQAINEWGRAGGPPSPDHPKLTSYLSRRIAHLLKLCIISAVASGDELRITIDNFVEALDWLVEIESFMPDIFKSMKTGGDGRVIEECWHYAYQIFIKEQKPVAEPRIVHFLQERTPAHNITRILEVMERARLLEKKFIAGGYGYEPKARKAA